MRYKVFIISLILVISAGYAYWDQVRAPTPIPQTHTEHASDDTVTRIPDAHFTSLAGRTYTLHGFEGRVVVLNFWASWCAPCIIEFPILLDLAKSYPEDLVLIALSVDEKKSNITKFLTQHKFNTSAQNVIISHDVDKAISQDLFQTTLYPETYIIGPDLGLKEKITGFTSQTGDDLKKHVEMLIKAH